MKPARLVPGLLFVALAGACTSAPAPAEPASSSPASSASTVAVVPPSAAAPTPATPASAPAVASAAPVPSASASVAADAEPLPAVDVKFYGLHVGGGKNDKAEHAPIISSVNAHLDEFKRCFAKVDDPKKGGSFGIQLDIPGEGGKAAVSRPRNGLKGDAFKDCMVAVYEGIEFEKPKGGVKTNATYSLMFTPRK